MRAELINPFLTSAIEVLKMEIQSEPQRGQLSLADASWTTQDVTVMVPVVGPVEGTFQLGLSEGTAMAMTSVMMGEDISVFNEWVLSAMGEMGNIIAGRALIKLEQLGYSAEIGPPTVLYGEPARISTLDRKKLQIPLQTGLGVLEISICLRENTVSKNLDR